VNSLEVTFALTATGRKGIVSSGVEKRYKKKTIPRYLSTKIP
jgi:hypothetical protein